MGAAQSKKEEPSVGKTIAKHVEKVADKTEKAVDKTSKTVSKAADKASDKVVETITIFSKKVAPPEPEEEDTKFKDALPVIGVVVLIAAVGAYLWKKKPWKKGEAGKPA